MMRPRGRRSPRTQVTNTFESSSLVRELGELLYQPDCLSSCCRIAVLCVARLAVYQGCLLSELLSAKAARSASVVLLSIKLPALYPKADRNLIRRARGGGEGGREGGREDGESRGG